MSLDRQVNRRNFFRHGLSELLRPLAQAAEPLEEAIRQMGAMDTASRGTPPPAPANPPSLAAQVRRPPDAWLRPPGALPEQQFRETCSRCGDCVRVCPVQCIKIDPTGSRGAGAPYIEVDVMPCAMCDGLLCMHECPSGALTPTPLADIDMGTAVWHDQTCLRSSGEGCTICVDRCPIGEVAIRLHEGKIQVIESGCTGCGTCQHHCPTTPKSITITPRKTGGPVPRARW